MRLNRILLMAASFSLIIFAMVFTISCSGDDGARGADGATGPAGPAGPAGAAGAAGAPCIVQETAKDSGIFDVLCGGTKVGQLRSGADGQNGQNGTNGADGQNGQNGTNGADGQNGQNGTNGADGQTPSVRIGENGNWWVNGTDTEIAATGPTGPTGPTGATATAADVLELITLGKDGYWYIGSFKTNIRATPEVGDDGNWWVNGNNTGVAATGNHGLTPYVGANGNWWVGNEDLGTAATGTSGDHGVTPRIGDNGNWFFGEEDTHVLAQGTNGKLVEIIDDMLWVDGEPTGIHANHKCTIERDNLSIWCDNVDVGSLDEYFCRFQAANELNLGKDILKCGSTTLWLCQGLTVGDGFNCEEKKCESTGGFYEDGNKGYNYFPHCYIDEPAACASGDLKGHANYKWESGSCVAKSDEEKCEDAGKFWDAAGKYGTAACYANEQTACSTKPTWTWENNECVEPGKDPQEECEEDSRFWDSGKSECFDDAEAACISDTDYKWESGSCEEKSDEEKCEDAGKYWESSVCYASEEAACGILRPTHTWEDNVCVPPGQTPQQTCEAEADHTWDATLGAEGECLEHIEVCGDDWDLANTTFTTIPSGFYNVLTRDACLGSKFLCRGDDNVTKTVTYNGVTKNDNTLNESSSVHQVVQFDMVKDDSERTILIVDAGTVYCTTGY